MPRAASPPRSASACFPTTRRMRAPSSSTPTKRCIRRSRPARTPTASTPPARSRSRRCPTGLLVLDDVLDALEEVDLHQRLHDVVVGAEVAAALGVLVAREARHHGDRQLLRARVGADE